jgi:hypothetical protein
MRPEGSTLGVRIIAFITEAVAVRDILAHLGEATTPPRLMPARDPPLWQTPDAGRGEYEPQAQPAPDYELDQHIAWQAPRRDEPPSLVMGRLMPGVTRPAAVGPGLWHQAVTASQFRPFFKDSPHEIPD